LPRSSLVLASDLHKRRVPMFRNIASAVCAFSLLFLPTGAFGQEAQKPSEEDRETKELMALINTAIVSASKSEQTLSTAPAKIVVITADEIRTRGYMGLDEIFTDLAG